MKIRNIKFKEHHIFKNLELSFIDANGNPKQTILIAGENGSGKTLLLDTIFKLSDLPLTSDLGKLINKGEFEFELSTNEVNNIISEVVKNNPYLEEYIDKDSLNQDINFIFKIFYEGDNSHSGFNINLLSNPSFIKNQYTSSFRNMFFNNFYNITSRFNLSKLKRIFSTVEINFTPDIIRSVTSKDIDTLNGYSFISTNNISTDIKQLFIDIFNHDNAIKAEALSQVDTIYKGFSSSEIENNLDLKIKRFQHAFEAIIPFKKMAKAQPINGEQCIIFKDIRNDSEISLDNLSSGEKQIIFRGAFLLQNQKIIENPIVCIDEPELTLHPEWQLKILDFYKNIFMDQNGSLSAQLFIATHSPFILHGLNRYDDKVIILARSDQGSLYIKENPEFYGFSQPKLIHEAFTLPDNFFSESSYSNIIYVEGVTDELYLNKVIQVFNLKIGNCEIKCIGNPQENKGSGDLNLSSALNYFYNNRHELKNRKLCFLFDCDSKNCRKNLEIPGKLLVRKHKQYNSNIKIGIENTLILPNDLDIIDFTRQKETCDDYGITNKINTLDKKRLAEKICSLDNEKLKEIFINLKESIEPIINEMNNTHNQSLSSKP